MSAAEGGTGIAAVVGRFLRLALLALVILFVVVVLVEFAARRIGMEPQNLYRVGFSATVIDRWTEWAMRPSVRLNEYAVTNAYGLHEDREVNLQKPPGTRRIAVIGSSVTWGLGEALENTIPRAAEKTMRKAGCEVEVLNFGNQGFNILNASAYIQAKIHQFNPDAVVVMMDLQMGVPRFPMPNPVTDEQAVVRRLGFWEGLLKRASEYSIVLTALDNVGIPRAELARRQPLPIEPKGTKPAQTQAAPPPPDAGQKDLLKLWHTMESRATASFDALKAKEPGPLSVRAAPAPPPAATQPKTIASYEEQRDRELGSVVAAVSAFARQIGIKLYFVTPYGPYFRASPQELEKFSLNMLAEAKTVYGGLPAATAREAELVTQIVSKHAQREGASVIDMLAASRAATMATGDFSTDGIHFSAQGYRNVGALIADRLMKDGLCQGGAAAGKAS